MNASITIHVEILNEQRLWDHANRICRSKYKDENPEDLIGTREEPDIEGCLQLIFDPGDSPPGIQIDDSVVEITPPF